MGDASEPAEREGTDSGKAINGLLPRPAQDVIKHQGKLPSKICKSDTLTIVMFPYLLGWVTELESVFRKVSCAVV